MSNILRAHEIDCDCDGCMFAISEEDADAAIEIMAEIEADEAELAAIEDAELDAELERQAERAEGYWFGELLD